MPNVLVSVRLSTMPLPSTVTSMPGPPSPAIGCTALRMSRRTPDAAASSFAFSGPAAADAPSGPVIALASRVWASPPFASPGFASPVFASPDRASPVFASPDLASPALTSPDWRPGLGLAGPSLAGFGSPALRSPDLASPDLACPGRSISGLCLLARLAARRRLLTRHVLLGRPCRLRVLGARRPDHCGEAPRSTCRHRASPSAAVARRPPSRAAPRVSVPWSYPCRRPPGT